MGTGFKHQNPLIKSLMKENFYLRSQIESLIIPLIALVFFAYVGQKLYFNLESISYLLSVVIILFLILAIGIHIIIPVKFSIEDNYLLIEKLSLKIRMRVDEVKIFHLGTTNTRFIIIKDSHSKYVIKETLYSSKRLTDLEYFILSSSYYSLR